MRAEKGLISMCVISRQKKNKIEAQSAMWKSIVLNMCHRLELEESWKKLEREREKKIDWLIETDSVLVLEHFLE